MRRLDFELKRQLLHLLLGIAIVYFFYAGWLKAWMLFIAIILGLILSLISRKRKLPIISSLLSILERKEDINKFPGKGLIAYLVGSFLAMVVFQRDIASASIMILALGDSISRLVGPFGKIKHPFDNTKFVEGLVAGALAAFIGARFFVKPAEAIIASIIAMFLEGMNPIIGKYKINDNITIPIVAGAVIWVIRTF